MSVLATTCLALSMSADTFAASISRGISMKRPDIKSAIWVGSVFAIVQTLTPIVGWLCGMTASDLISSYDHWVAFTILTLLGGKMITDGLAKECEEENSDCSKFWLLLLTAIGTSIDAMAVGVTFAVIKTSIWTPAAAIGVATFFTALVGIFMGRFIGIKGGKIAEVLGGVGLIAIGSKILLEHLGYIG